MREKGEGGMCGEAYLELALRFVQVSLLADAMERVTALRRRVRLPRPRRHIVLHPLAPLQHILEKAQLRGGQIVPQRQIVGLQLKRLSQRALGAGKVGRAVHGGGRAAEEVDVGAVGEFRGGAAVQVDGARVLAAEGEDVGEVDPGVLEPGGGLVHGREHGHGRVEVALLGQEHAQPVGRIQVLAVSAEGEGG